jgi:hypothetical protein
MHARKVECNRISWILISQLVGVGHAAWATMPAVMPFLQHSAPMYVGTVWAICGPVQKNSDPPAERVHAQLASRSVQHHDCV